MRIESILSPGAQGLWKLRLEDGSSLLLSEEDMLTNSLRAEMELDEGQLAALRQLSARAQLRQRAMDMLLRRPYSKGELAERLLRGRDVDAETAEEVCLWAERIGLLQEDAYAALIVRRYQERGYGLYRIKQELYRRRIPRELWDELLEELDGEAGAAAIDRYLERHLRSREPRDVKRAADALARRGFSWSEVAAGIRRHGAAQEEGFDD